MDVIDSFRINGRVVVTAMAVIPVGHGLLTWD